MILADFWLSGSVSLKRIRIRLTKMKRIRIRNTDKKNPIFFWFIKLEIHNAHCLIIRPLPLFFALAVLVP